MKGLNNAGILAFFANEFTYMKLSRLVHCIKDYMDCFSYITASENALEFLCSLRFNSFVSYLQAGRNTPEAND